MSFNIHLNNLNKNIKGPTNPTKASELFTGPGAWKFTALLQPGVPLIVENDMDFINEMMLSQFQNTNVRWGAADASGGYVKSADQQGAMFVFRKPHSGQVDLTVAPKLRFEAMGPPHSPAVYGTWGYGTDKTHA